MKRKMIMILVAIALLAGVLATGAMAATEDVCKIGETGYATVAEAVTAAQEGAVITLLKDVENAEIAKSVTIDLNGNDASIQVTDGVVTLQDSQTDDFDVSDGNYGKVTATGEVAAAAGYMAVTEGNVVSYHKVELDITAMSMRASVAGVYYKSMFNADAVAATGIAKYGVALNVKEEPNASNMETTSSYSYFTKFTSGNANGTLLKNIMRKTNIEKSNARNAEMTIYGRPYILTTGGTYIFGETVQRSFKEQMEAIDAQWSTYSEAARETVLWMYKDYKATMDKWNISSCKAAADPASDGVLKILVIGNSHGLDVSRMLYDVFAEQNPKQKVVIGALYYSGCRMDQHRDFMAADQRVYDYHKTDDGTWEVNFGKGPGSSNPALRSTAAEGILDDNWDVVTMQQMNLRAGIDEPKWYDASDYNYVVDYVLDRQVGTPKFLWHMTWANPEDYANFLDDNAPYGYGGVSYATSWRDTHEQYFGNGTYGSYKSINMYNAVVANTNKYLTDSTEFLGRKVFEGVISTATAMQYANDVLGYEDLQLYSDYTHLSDFTRLMASYVYYGEITKLITGEEVTISEVKRNEINPDHHRNNSKYPAKSSDGKYPLTDKMKDDLIESVNWALAHPFELPAAK